MSSIGVAAAVFDDRGHILCVKQNYGDRLWALPGGAVEPGESPIMALEREVEEETGYLVLVKDLIGVYSTPWKDTLFLCFMTDIVEQVEWHPDDEIAAKAFFARGALPEPMSSRMRWRILDAFNGERGIVRVFTARD